MFLEAVEESYPLVQVQGVAVRNSEHGEYMAVIPPCKYIHAGH